MERSQILKSAGIPHFCDPADIDERELKDRMAKQGADEETTTASLAQAKAEEVQKRHAQALVIGADQILEYEGKRFEKSQDQDDAAGNPKDPSRLHASAVQRRGGTRGGKNASGDILKRRASL